ncbi:MAG: BamA/TamA family outer membrane protein [Acidobacteriota bacterium]
MNRARVGLLAPALLVMSVSAAVGQAPAGEILGEVRVHGNHTTPDADVLALAGLTLGAPLTGTTLEAAAQRLRDSGRFAGIEVRKRYRSIDNPLDIVVIVIVDEHAAVSEDDLVPGSWKRIRAAGMWLPILDYTDGYGFSYGARLTFVEAVGPRSRVSVPLTWGGERRAAAEVERTFERGPLSRVAASVSINRREHPHFEIGETRQNVSVGADHAWGSRLRIGAGARLTNVRFGPIDERHVAPSAHLVLDTRIDPLYPRHAVHLLASVEQLRFPGDRHVGRSTVDLRGYVGLYGSSVLAVRSAVTLASRGLPAYEQALLGGSSSLRGYGVGYRVGDNLGLFSAEVRWPLTSPLSAGRLGVKAFVDAGTVYAAGVPLRGQTFDRGIGGGVFLTAAVLQLGLDVAWPESGRARWHFGLSTSF